MGPGGAFPGQPPTATDGQASRPAARRPRLGKKILTIIAGVAVIAMAATAFVVLRPHPASTRTAQTPPASPTSPTSPASASSPASPATARPNLTSKIDNVVTDPRPITMAEIFPAGRVTTDGRQFVRVAAVVNRNCALTARSSFAVALTAGKCQRVVRATYVDSSKRFAVTAGVAALPTKALAERVNRAKRLKRNLWFAGLDGQRGSGAQLISVTGGYAYGIVDGRYIIFAYATYANGHTPTGRGALDHVVASLSRSFAMLAEQPITARAQGS